MWILYVLLGLLAALIAVLLLRTLRFTPHKDIAVQDTEESFDRDKVISNLQELIRCKTVSYYDAALEDDAEFEKLIDMLPFLYPAVFRVCSFEQLADRALLFRWEGRSHDAPTVLMAHYDVVPVNEEQWDKPPFEALIEDGVMWGRGTLDTKATFNGVLSAADHLIEQGFIPAQDIYFAFSGGEEVNGLGAVNIVDYFEQNGITPALVLDEGGAVVENVFPGVAKPCGLIGIAEKGFMNVQYTTHSNGGHASSPKPHTPVGVLANACRKVENRPFPYHITTPVKALFDTLGRHSSFVYRMIFANLWLFAPVLDLLCKKQGGELNALMRTTVAFTQMQGSSAPNVIPPQATMVSNIRLNPQDSTEFALNYLKKTVDDDAVEVTMTYGMNPSHISQIDCDAYRKVAVAVASTWRGCLVSPYLMVACSDSRHYDRISDKVYRFSAMDMTNEERATIHGNNERVRLEVIDRVMEFYLRLMRQC